MELTACRKCQHHQEMRVRVYDVCLANLVWDWRTGTYTEQLPALCCRTNIDGHCPHFKALAEEATAQEPPAVAHQRSSIFDPPITCVAVEDIAKDELCVVDCTAGTIRSAAREAEQAEQAEQSAAQPESRVMRSEPGEQWWITAKGVDVQCIWQKLASGEVVQHLLKGVDAGECCPTDAATFAKLIESGPVVPIDELEARVLIFEAQANRWQKESRRGVEAFHKGEELLGDETKRREKAEAELADATITITELKTKLKLTEANEKDLQAQIKNLDDAATEYSKVMREARHALDAQRAKEAERVTAIERGIKDLVRGYWCKMQTAMDFMLEYARKGRWARFKTPFPYQDVAHIVAWDAASERDDGLFKHEERAVAEAFRHTGMLLVPAPDDTPEPGSQPAVHPV